MKLTLILLAVMVPAFSGVALAQSAEPGKELVDSTSLPHPPRGNGEEGSPPFGLGDDAPEWLSLNKLTPARFVVDPPGLAVRAGFLAFQRAALDNNPLIQSPDVQTTLFDTGSYVFDWAKGVDLGLSYRVQADSFHDGWDARYMGVDGATAQENFATPGPWTIPGDSTIWPQANITARYDSRVMSAEWNLQHDAETCCLTWLAGFRWLRLADDLSTRATFSNADTLTLSTETSNDLFGGQLGVALAIRKLGTPLEIAARLKAGLYANSSTATSVISQTSQGGGMQWTGSGDGRQLAFVGDVEFDAVYHLSDRWSTYVAWQMLWLEGVAVAGSQPQPGALIAGAPAFDLDNGAWFSGISAGLQMRW
jgi:hypothetical protein